MRLTYLRLKNFMSHSNTELDLSGIRAAVGSGPTGGGKSALFVEAPVWALFGRVRSKRADGWVKIGADECQVEVGFDSNGTSYRVVRSRSLKTKAGKSDLQLAAKNGAGWVPLSGKSIAETQAKIEQVLGVSYDTITSANISRQKESDKFTNPGTISIDGHQYTGAQARIQVLAQMLGLGIYAEWRQMASNMARGAEVKAETLEAQVADIDRTLAMRPDLESTLAQTEMVLTDSRQQQATLMAQIDQTARDLARLEAQIPEAQKKLAAFGEDRRLLDTRRQSLRVKSGTAERYRGLFARRQEIEAADVLAKDLDASLGVKRQDLAALAADGKSLVSQITDATGRAKDFERAKVAANGKLAEDQRKVAQRDALAAQVVELTAAREAEHLVRLEVEGIDAKVTEWRAKRDAMTTENATAQEARGKILAEEKRVTAEKAGLEPQIAGHAKRTAVMDIVPCIGVADLAATCPLLKDARESLPVLDTLRGQHAHLCAWVRAPLPEIQPTDKIDHMVRGLTSARTTAQAKLSTLDAILKRLASSEADLASISTIAETIPDLQADLEMASAAHADATKTLKSLQDRLETVKATYVATKDEVSQGEAKLATLRAVSALLPDLGQAQRDLPGLEAEIEALNTEILSLTARLAKEAEVSTWLSGATGTATQFRGDGERWRKDLSAQRSIEQMAIEKSASARADMDRLTALEGEQTAARMEAAALRTRHSLLLALAEAYRQIPLMILETMAIPALEEEANRILGRISSNGMWIRLATQRAVKSRDTLADALDIIVTDTVGERSYEEYSGGENFEVDLALRIALAKLQARKAGATIQTLILDEGMGTQSGDRLDALVAALREIQNDFPLLLVITHVEALKETFPARIQVSGGPQNSVAELITA